MLNTYYNLPNNTRTHLKMVLESKYGDVVFKRATFSKEIIFHTKNLFGCFPVEEIPSILSYDFSSIRVTYKGAKITTTGPR
jgi:hypothetical protein